MTKLRVQLDPPFCPFLCTLWHMFFTENEKILNMAILTSGMNILTVTVDKNYSEMIFYEKYLLMRPPVEEQNNNNNNNMW